MSSYIRKHIYSVILYFSPTQNSHYQYGPYQFEYLPVYIEIRDQLANAEVHGEASKDGTVAELEVFHREPHDGISCMRLLRCADADI